GVRLFAYNLNQQTLLWECEVEQPLAEHSKYWNRVYLSFYEGRIILEGQEAYAEYVQIFEGTTGKRVFSKLYK
ncbi:MAG: hypothetical protein EAZ55_12435, partial [Cytophagales bacterium]